MQTKNFLIRTAIKKLKEGKTIKIDDNLLCTVFKARKNGSEVWMRYPGLEWAKYGSPFHFTVMESGRRFVVME